MKTALGWLATIVVTFLAGGLASALGVIAEHLFADYGVDAAPWFSLGLMAIIMLYIFPRARRWFGVGVT